MTKKSTQSGHNVSHPPIHEFHCPPQGGNFSPRLINLSKTPDDITWTIWHGYEEESHLDQVYAQVHKEESQKNSSIRITDEPGVYSQPDIIAHDQYSFDAAWVQDEIKIVTATLQADRVQKTEVYQSNAKGWLRSVALYKDPKQQLWMSFIESDNGKDYIHLYRKQQNHWTQILKHNTKGFTNRLSLLVSKSDKIYLTFDCFIQQRYQVRILKYIKGECLPCFIKSSPSYNFLNPCLTESSTGQLFLSYLKDHCVQRDQVISKACSIQAAMFDHNSWISMERNQSEDIVPLHMGLLPQKRYFGYNGLRRNPKWVASENNEMYLLWEAQRDETECWDNLNNGHYIFLKHKNGEWSEPKLLNDGGCCFHIDHRSIFKNNQLSFSFKREHQKEGDDFIVIHKKTSELKSTTVKKHSHNWLDYTPLEYNLERPSIKLNDKIYYLYFGDLHVHSIFSPDAEGFPDEQYHFAQHISKIDFMATTENDYYPGKVYHQSEFAYTQKLIDYLNQNDSFLAMQGYEWTFHRNDHEESYNHRIVLYDQDTPTLHRRIEKEGYTEENFYNSMKKSDAVIFPHHGEFNLLGLEQEKVMEVCSGWDVNIEKYPTYHNELNQGHQAGFIANSDCHRSVPGLGGALVAVWAESLTKDSIMEALKNRRCYATMGNRSSIEFSINNGFMGSMIQSKNNILLKAKIHCDKTINNVTLYHNGIPIQEFKGQGDNKLSIHWEHESEKIYEGWFYLRVEESGTYQDFPHNIAQGTGPLSWSSPIWMKNS